MSLKEYVVAAGLIALSFGAGAEYTKIKYSKMPFGVVERNGEYFFVNKSAKKEYSAQQMEKMTRIVSQLAEIMDGKKKAEEPKPESGLDRLEKILER